MKAPPAPWSIQKLRVSFGAVPEVLTFIHLPICRRSNSGQVWQVMKVRGHTLHCMVMPSGHDFSKEPPEAVHLNWEWDTRSRRHGR